jgi:DNA-binding transcriptional MerR regulator
MRASDLGRSVELSAQQIRNYEASGLLPVAERAPNGYRVYTDRHVAALKAVRAMLAANYGQERATEVMQAIHQGETARALSVIDSQHARLDRQRRQVERAMEAFRTISTELRPVAELRRPRALRIGEAARAVGVQPSAVRFWEAEGLLQPSRDRESGYRQYDRQQLRRLEMIVLLRGANYRFEAIRSVLDELAAGRPEASLRALEQRREELARASRACALATVAIIEYAERWA